MSHTTELKHMGLTIETSGIGYPFSIHISQTRDPYGHTLTVRHDEIGDLISALQRAQQYLRAHVNESMLRELE